MARTSFALMHVMLSVMRKLSESGARDAGKINRVKDLERQPLCAVVHFRVQRGGKAHGCPLLPHAVGDETDLAHFHPPQKRCKFRCQPTCPARARSAPLSVTQPVLSPTSHSDTASSALRNAAIIGRSTCSSLSNTA